MNKSLYIPFPFLILGFIGMLYAFPSIAQEAALTDSIKTKKEKQFSFAAIALPSKDPEDGFYVDGGIITVFKTDRKDTTLRVSNLYVYALYSQLHQYRISTGGDIFTKNEKYYLNGWFYNSYLPEYYFGTGNNVSPSTKEYISYKLWYINANVLRKIYKKIFVGLTYNYENLYNMKYPKDGIADRNKPKGLNNYTISAPGIRVRHDSRDNILSSRTGSYVDVFYSFFRPGLGSQYNFNMFGFDARKFINLTPTPKKYNILALNFVIKQSSGNVPFRYLSNISARGYHPNLYRDNSLLSLQAEYRFKIWNWFGASVFGGASEVAGSFAQMNLKYIRENYGGGFRFRIFKKNNMYMRVEYGMSSNTSNYYISFTDAF
ncbi:MAG TPA: hypothetical protein VNW06_12640 [Cytophagaceae bacterium]|nr:hypothetical protein [Cytophagaceae bacterium]